MKEIKKSLLYVVLLITVIEGILFRPIIVQAASSYDSVSAVNYAATHWSDGRGLCAEFVSNCINAGGCTAWSTSCTALRSQLLRCGMGTEYSLDLESDMSIKGTRYSGILEPGDVVFYHCSGCTDGKPYIHAVLCNGNTSDGYMRAFSHNNANSGSSKYVYSSKCYDCGGKIDKAYVYHFNSEHIPFGCVDSVTGGMGTVNVSGWAIDEDTPNAAVEIYVYVGNTGYAIKADKQRTDVNNVYGMGNYHGFEDTISVKERGNQVVSVYAINTGTGDNRFLGSKTVNITEKCILNFASNASEVKSGETLLVPYTFSGSNIYTFDYSISDENIARVASWGETDFSKGTSGVNVQGIKEGTSILTISLLDKNRNVLCSQSVEIHVKPVQQEYSIIFDVTELRLKNGEQKTVECQFQGEGTLAAYLESGDVVSASCSRVDHASGICEFTVSALAEGTTRLYVQYVDDVGNVLYERGISIIVERQPEEVLPEKEFGIDFDFTTLGFQQYDEMDVGFNFYGDGIYTLGYDIDNKDVVAVKSWQNTNYATGRSGLTVEGIGVGTAKLTIKLLDRNYNTLYSNSMILTVNETTETYELVEKEFIIDFDQEEMEIMSGESVDIGFDFFGDGIYTLGYSVGDESVISVNSWMETNYGTGRSGIRVTALGAGSTKLTIKLLDVNYNTLFEKSMNIAVCNSGSSEVSNVYDGNEESYGKVKKYANQMIEYGKTLGLYDAELETYIKNFMEQLGW